MAHDVHLHVAFECDNNDHVAELAKKHRVLLMLNEENPSIEALWFLDALSARKDCNEGPKGGLSLWGIVGNYTNPMQFAEALRPFWIELLSASRESPLSFHHVVIMYEQEQSEHAGAVEVFWNEDPPREEGELIIKDHPGLPFCFNQF